jgi:hypothetical protein
MVMMPFVYEAKRAAPTKKQKTKKCSCLANLIGPDPFAKASTDDRVDADAHRQTLPTLSCGPLKREVGQRA